MRGRDGTLISSIAVPKGSIAVLNLWACNTNPALWGEDAFTWRPERWLAPLPRALEDARIPGVYSNLYVYALYALMRLLDKPTNRRAQDVVPWRGQVVHVSRARPGLSLRPVLTCALPSAASSTHSWK